MLSGGLAELLTKVAEGEEAVFVLPGKENCFEATAHYAIDGVTEKVCVDPAGITYSTYLNILIWT